MPWDPEHIPTQVGKTFVVTGGNAGIGYFIAEQLAAAGGQVVITSRTQARADAALAAIRAQVPGAQVSAVLLDLSSFASVRAAAATLSSLPRIEALIENAGSIMATKGRAETEDGNELMFGTNHLGHFLLTALLFPTLEKTPASRIVTVGSGATRLRGFDLDDLQSTKGRYSAFGTYARSKHATQSFGFELDRRLRAAGSSVTALVAHPGGAQDGNSPRRPGVLEPTSGERLRARLLFFIGGSKETAAWSIVRAATDPDARGGDYWGPRNNLSGPPVRQKPAAQSHGAGAGASLWRTSEDLVGQRFPI
ncbi:SDR family NAD(P)-dependent oxidoreductase [Lacisediminihabitans changchengi]|uniref:SDR family NAD(P)-dependent oxidoreductase n=1 Tax=Lacisediminihabitans changchengi TaxID=2787634 RepID=A0A934SND7_9MICO|nr:SDR family NAD(P)-dependent oxidoreductase [Lacisediminihabitans changchengi]MBK4348580.1 SDR family NAD(P)-dependent oxidoreductase [Lacisediminihabitans changchengi]